MGKILNIICALTLLCTGFAACNTAGCLENQSSIPQAGFYSDRDSTQITVDSISVYGIGSRGDSSLVYGVRASWVYLPLRSDMPSTSFCFRYLQKELDIPELNDTLTIDYTSEPRFVSEECGAMYFYTITRIAHTSHFIESVELLDSFVNNYDRERIKIYFRVAEPEDTTTITPPEELL